MRKEVKEAIKELCVRTREIRNGDYKNKNNKPKKR
jgi:hypothetical protein